MNPSQPRASFLERSLVEINHTLEQTLFAEQIARRRGLLQGLDPRVKVLALLALLLAVGLSRSLAVLGGLYGLALLLAALSAVPLGYFVKRVWLLIPFFSGLVALPALFLTPGPVLAQLPLGLVITSTGLRAAAFLLLRVGDSVSLGILLVLTTPWNSLLAALGVLRLPDMLILILEMTYRYLHLLLNSAADMFLSRRSRLIQRPTPAEERKILAAHMGVLLNRSLQTSEEVYLAMQSRGYRGYPRTLNRFALRRRDWLAASLALLIAAAAAWLGR